MQEQQLELRDLLILLAKRSWFIAICVIAAGFAAKKKADKEPDLFQSTALLIPTEPPKASGKNSILAAASSSSDASDLALYSALMRSRLVMREVLLTKVLVSPNSPDREMVSSILHIDTTDELAMQLATIDLAGAINLNDVGNGILQLSFTSTSQYLAPQMADIITSAAQRSIHQVRIERFNTVLARLETSSKQSKDELRKAALRQAQFEDHNSGLEVARLRVMSQEIESETKMREQTYLMARQKADQMRLERDQLYPPAVVLDPASRPALRIGPNRRAKVMMGAFVGFVLGAGLVVAWEFLLRKRRT